MKKKILMLASATAGICALASPDPLRKANAYSLELSAEMQESKHFFPLGILGDRNFELLPSIGLNITENTHTCYEFREGKPCTYRRNGNGLGKFFFCHWAAHTLFNSRETENYGTLKNLVKDNGEAAGRHSISIAHPATRQYVLDVAASSTKHVVEQESDNVFLWGIDNEYELGPDYSEESVALFREWLADTYKNNLEMFKEAWRDDEADFQSAVPPKIDERNVRPGAWLDWRRYSEEMFAAFLRDYFSAIQDNDPLKRAVVAKNTQCSLEMQAVARNRVVNHELIAELTRDISQGLYGFDQYGHGDRNVYEQNYFYNCIRPKNPEPGKRYGTFSAENNNHAGPGNQFAQTYYRMIPNGLRGINFFVIGHFGAKNDYTTFSFTYPDGVRRDRFYYLSRFGAMVHRTEKFWSESAPAEDIPRIAMLLPQRDIMLAGDMGRSLWDYSVNDRLNVFSRLRDAGYWVDIIPYGQLDAEWLQRFDALVLVGAEHLGADECAAIAGYVRQGGSLLSDMRTGHFNEHHLETAGLSDVLGMRHIGVYTGIEVSPDDLWYNTSYGNIIRGDGKILADITTAEIINKEDIFRNAKGATITKNKYGKGNAYWFNTRLGALRTESAPVEILTEWFGDRLKDAGAQPAYYTTPSLTGRIRIEQPSADQAGNLIIAVTGTDIYPLPPFELAISLPEKTEASSAWWCPAESTWLEQIEFKSDGNGKTIFQMPEIASAGMLYLLSEHPPLLGLKIEGAEETVENDKYTAKFKPGDTFTVRAQVVNASRSEISAGMLKLQALSGWEVSEAVKTSAINAGKNSEFVFKVTIPETNESFKPNAVYPLVATLELDGKRVAVANAIIALELDPSSYPSLLSDNPTWGNRRHEFTILTGAEYTYELPEGGTLRDPVTAKEDGKFDNALNKGLDWWTNVAKFNAPSVNVIFDLKAEYKVEKVLIKGKQTMPVSMQVFSGDGTEFTEVSDVEKLEWDGEWSGVAINPSITQHIKLEVNFADAGGGFIDEIEIYGRPAK
jgi:hypothetical protein